MKRVLIPIIALSGLVFQPLHAQDPEQLFQQKACVACHAIKAQRVGPAYEEVAERYAGQEDALETLADSIRNGSEGKWGDIPMPPNAVTEEEATALAEWVLDQG